MSAHPEQIATLEVRGKAGLTPADHAYFVGAVHAAERLGCRVEITVTRTRFDTIDQIIATAHPGQPAAPQDPSQ